MKPQTGVMIAVVAIGTLAALGFQLLGTCTGDTVKTPVEPSPPQRAPNAINISMASSITKWEWLEQAVETFNERSESDSDLQVDGKPVWVEVLKEKDPLDGRMRHWNSPTQVFATVDQKIKPTILSPAAST